MKKFIIPLYREVKLVFVLGSSKELFRQYKKYITDARSDYSIKKIINNNLGTTWNGLANGSEFIVVTVDENGSKKAILSVVMHEFVHVVDDVSERYAITDSEFRAYLMDYMTEAYYNIMNL